MYMICRHIKTNGIRCQSPALTGFRFCYYHDKTHLIGTEPHMRFGPLQLPVPEDSASIQLSIARINAALIMGYIDLKKATGLLYGIQIAAQFIDRKKPFDENKTVQSAEQMSDGDELAPDEFICEADEVDCKDCPHAAPCPHYIHRDGKEVRASKSAPKAKKPKAPAPKTNPKRIKSKKSKNGRETVTPAEPPRNQQAADKAAQPAQPL
jgi:hypothetical protein